MSEGWKVLTGCDPAVNPGGDDVVYVVQDPLGTPKDTRVQIKKLLAGADNGSGQGAAIANMTLPIDDAPAAGARIIIEKDSATPGGPNSAGRTTIANAIKTGLPAAAWTVDDTVSAIRESLKNPYYRVPSRYLSPAPDSTAEGRWTSRRKLAEAIGAELVIVVTGDSITLDPATTEEGAWAGDILILIPHAAPAEIAVTGRGPVGRRLTIINNKSVPAVLTFDPAIPDPITIQSKSRADYFFDFATGWFRSYQNLDGGRVLSRKTLATSIMDEPTAGTNHILWETLPASISGPMRCIVKVQLSGQFFGDFNCRFQVHDGASALVDSALVMRESTVSDQIAEASFVLTLTRPTLALRILDSSGPFGEEIPPGIIIWGVDEPGHLPTSMSIESLPEHVTPDWG